MLDKFIQCSITCVQYNYSPGCAYHCIPDLLWTLRVICMQFVYLFTFKKNIVFMLNTAIYNWTQLFQTKMDSNSFREFGQAALEFCADYLENIDERYYIERFLNIYCEVPFYMRIYVYIFTDQCFRPWNLAICISYCQRKCPNRLSIGKRSWKIWTVL